MCKPPAALAARQLTEEAVRHAALAEPLLVPAGGPGGVRELGLALPAQPLTPDRVKALLGANYEVGRLHGGRGAGVYVAEAREAVLSGWLGLWARVAQCCATGLPLGDSAMAPCTASGPHAALVQGPACRAQPPRPPRPPAPQVRTFDCGAQVEGPHWTLHQWTLYWEARRPLNKVRRPPGRQSRLHPLPSPPPPLLLGWCNDHALSRGRWVERRRGAQPQLRPPGTCLPCLPTAPAMLLLLLLLHVQEAFVAPPPRAALPAEDEADSAAVTRKRTADSDITGQARSCAGAVLSPGLRLGPH